MFVDEPGPRVPKHPTRPPHATLSGGSNAPFRSHRWFPGRSVVLQPATAGAMLGHDLQGFRLGKSPQPLGAFRFGQLPDFVKLAMPGIGAFVERTSEQQTEFSNAMGNLPGIHGWRSLLRTSKAVSRIIPPLVIGRNPEALESLPEKSDGSCFHKKGLDGWIGRRVTPSTATGAPT